MTGIQHLPKKLFGSVGITGGTQPEVQRGPRRIDGAVERIPALLDLDRGLIDPVRIGSRPQIWPASRIQLRRVALDPAKHRGVVDPHALFPQECFHIARAQGIAEVWQRFAGTWAALV